ncbi:MAG TPA: diaminopimelate decarboxylase [Chitinivibrionales bacterium]|nr:diaminopimelate decarboxylase [Chitinivibrionales bacterium]
MVNFHLVGEELYCESVPLSALAREFGTPAYVYSKASIINSIELLLGAFESLDVQICFSVKSNSNLSILRLMAQKGLGADIVSGGELFRALKAGIPPEKIVYSGVGKTAEEIRYALKSGIAIFNVESEEELYSLSDIAHSLDVIAPVSLRINPDIDANTHHHTTTAKKENKFGIPAQQAVDLYKRMNSLPHLNPVGIDVHLGSPILSLEPYRQALDVLGDIFTQLHGLGINLHTIDIGGGFGIVYNRETPFTPIQFAGLLAPYAAKLACNFIVEPGRFIVGNSGVLMATVIYVKQARSKLFYICDAGMNDLIRPPFYDAYHAIVPVVQYKDAPQSVADIVGPVCESSDFFAKARTIDKLEKGSLIAIRSAGAYSFSMASNYNSRPRPCEILVDGSHYSVIRRRETYQDLVSLEE